MVGLGVGSEHAACEPAPELYGVAAARPYGVPVDVRCATLEASGFADRSWDLVVLSHVLEHVPDPALLLSQALAIGRFVVAEVPIEGTASGRLRARLRQAVTGRQRTDNTAGHIQFFSTADVDRLVHWSGGQVIRSRAYFPRATYRRMSATATGWRRNYYGAWLMASRLVGPRLLTHLYYGHLAVLAEARHASVGHPLFWDG